MKFGQLIEHLKRNIFFKNYAENEAGNLVPDRFLSFIKALCYGKASGLQLDQGCQVQRKKMRENELFPKDSLSLMSPEGMVAPQLRSHKHFQN